MGLIATKDKNPPSQELQILNLPTEWFFAQSAGAVEYTDCFSAEG